MSATNRLRCAGVEEEHWSHSELWLHVFSPPASVFDLTSNPDSGVFSLSLLPDSRSLLAVLFGSLTQQ